jgi:hypothetical protein
MQPFQELYLSRIKPQNAYSDETSLYIKTGKQQRKYKLSLCSVADVYYFSKIFSDKNNCEPQFTVDIFKDDWSNRDNNYLWMTLSYCDVLQFDILNSDDLVRKIRNKYNGFPFIGTLCNQKFKKIYKLLRKSKYIKKVNPNIKRLSYIATKEISNKIIKKFDI